MSAALLRTRGVVFIHSAPAALTPHIQWAIEGALGARASVDWQRQPAAPGLQRMELSWVGDPGTGARIASALRTFEKVRFEVTEEASPGVDGSRWTHTPTLGIHHTTISASGDPVVTESHLREVLRLSQGSTEAIQEMVDELLGADWEAEIEPFRYAAEGAPVRWLHKVG